MCRIAAVISEDKASLYQRVSQMNDAMLRGGPDDAGIYVDRELPVALGLRRLSIIDLSDAGHQPFRSADGTLTLSFNGEIYNYPALKLQLQRLGYTFRSGSDTEVLLYAYAAWGTACLQKLEGMFAFVLLDRQKKIVLAARDHAGIKPLYYGKKGGDLYFSSEVRGLLAVDSGWPQNQRWPIWFLSFGFIPEPHTTLENVWHLPKGHYLVYDLQAYRYQVHAYEQPVFSAEITSYPEAVAAVRKSVQEAVNKHLLADVPVGVFLSGGIDSSILTLTAQQMYPDQLRTLSIYFEDEAYSEKYYQDLVIQKTGVAHQSYKVGREEFTSSLPDIYKAMDQPSTDGINTYFITRYAKEYGLKVVLSGLGADELFGGYPSFTRTDRIRKARRLHVLSHLVPIITGKYPIKKAAYLRENRWYNEYLLNRGLFTPDDVAGILGTDKKNVIEELGTYPEIPGLSQLEPRNRVSQLETDIYMQNQLLRDSDIYSMWHSVELRVPFLDKPLIQLARRIDPAVKFGKQPKQLLVDAFREELPESVWRRPKQGFTFPFENWFRQMPLLQNGYYVPLKWQRKFEKKQINYSRIWGVLVSRIFGGHVLPAAPAGDKTKTGSLFLYLSAFANTGGIEKVNRAFLKSFADSNNGVVTEAYGVYDSLSDSRYFPKYYFKGFNKQRLKFLWQLFTRPVPWNRVIAGHINLAPAILLLKLRKPHIRITLVTHGIEVWNRQKGLKKWLLRRADDIISVSHYTAKRLHDENGVPENKVKVLHNCLDPFFIPDSWSEKPSYLQRRYGIKKGDKVLLTIARLSHQEKYKGYDQVLQCIPALRRQYPGIRYLLCGKADAMEQQRIQTIIEREGIQENVLFTGYVPDDELTDHYRLADVFVMPSQGEGFGIVFIEAAACGTPVIAGNSDGSTEALLDGEIGKLIEPDDIEMLTRAIGQALELPGNKQQLGEKVVDHYRFEAYKERMEEVLDAGS
jgi:asparagine synthase (glutamine-hydrolysing)